MQKLPHEIFSYLRDHFHEGHLTHAQSVKTKEGHWHIQIEVTEDEVIHHLNFNEMGKLVQHHSEPVFKEDYYEGDFYGESE